MPEAGGDLKSGFGESDGFGSKNNSVISNKDSNGGQTSPRSPVGRTDKKKEAYKQKQVLQNEGAAGSLLKKNINKEPTNSTDENTSHKKKQKTGDIPPVQEVSFQELLAEDLQKEDERAKKRSKTEPVGDVDLGPNKPKGVKRKLFLGPKTCC